MLSFRAYRLSVDAYTPIGFTFLSLDLGHILLLTLLTVPSLHSLSEPLHASDDEGSDECGEEEPEESTGSLQLAAALGRGVSTTSDGVVANVALVVAAMCSVQLLRQHNTSDKGEDNGCKIQNTQNNWDGQTLNEHCCHSEKPDYPAKGGDEHGVVDCGVGFGLSREEVTDQCGNKEDPDELDDPDNHLSDMHFGGCGDIIFRLLGLSLGP